MEQLKNYFELIKAKMDEDPLIKKAIIGVAIAFAAIVLMVGLKAFKSSGSAVQEEAPALQAAPATVVQPATQPQAAPAAQAPVIAPAATQQIVSGAIKPASAINTMVPGYSMTYSYAGDRDIDNQGLFAKVADINRDTPSFQFLIRPDESLSQQIIPGDVTIQTKAVGYFLVDSQSSPLLNVLITTSGAARKVQVFIDDQVIPAIDNKTHGGYGVEQLSLPIVQTYAPGFHRITVLTTSTYLRRDLQTAVRLSIKRDTDPAPVDLQVYREAPIPAPVQAAPAVVTPATTPSTVQAVKQVSGGV